MPFGTGRGVKYPATSGSLQQRAAGSPRAVLRQRRRCWVVKVQGGVGVPPDGERIQGYTDTDWETIKRFTHESF